MPHVAGIHRFRTYLRNTRTPLPVAFARPWPTTRRGLVLFLFSLATTWLGVVNYIITDLPAVSRESLAFALAFAEPSVWGWAMVAIGALSAWSSFCHLGRDRIGFILLGGFCFAWGIGYMCGFVFFDAGPRALGGSVIWLLFSAILTAVAGFPNVPLSRSDAVTMACHPGEDR